jgi:hypothetical protein
MRGLMPVDMKEMVREGRFGWIDGALTRKELIELLGQPQMWGTESDLFDADIWRYGSIEFHFNGPGSRFWMIFSDHLDPFVGWDTIATIPWRTARCS